MITRLLSVFKQKQSPEMAWKRYCEKNPSAQCCRIYDV